MSENIYLGLLRLMFSSSGSTGTCVIQKETKSKDFLPMRTTLVSGFHFSNFVSILQHSVCSVQIQRDHLVSRSWKFWNLKCRPAWAAVGGREK